MFVCVRVYVILYACECEFALVVGVLTDELFLYRVRSLVTSSRSVCLPCVCVACVCVCARVYMCTYVCVGVSMYM